MPSLTLVFVVSVFFAFRQVIVKNAEKVKKKKKPKRPKSKKTSFSVARADF
jgi:hypothetical protein